MGKTFFLPMSPQDIERYTVIKRLLNNEMNASEAGRTLRLSVRQIQRIKGRVCHHGPRGVIHASRGKESHYRIPEKERHRIVKIVSKHYTDFTPTFAAEKLEEHHGIIHDRKTIQAMMRDAGVWKKSKHKKQQPHRAWRERKAAYGEMQQFDGSYHHWFEDRGGEQCLLASIDDATGMMTHAQFDDHEGLIPVTRFWEGYLVKHGKPLSLYLDKFSTYHMNHILAAENNDTKTQFVRAMENDLGITVITAHSPQAKGRIERLFKTLQDRLVKEMRLQKLSDIATANIFLTDVFIPQFNARFAAKPRSSSNLHRPLTIREQQNLSATLCRQERRVVRNDFTISYNSQWYQLTPNQPVTICKKDIVLVEERRDSTIHFRLRGKYLNFLLLPQRPQKVQTLPWVIPAGATNKKKKTRTNTPAKNHPWRMRMHTEVALHQLTKV